MLVHLDIEIPKKALDDIVEDLKARVHNLDLLINTRQANINSYQENAKVQQRHLEAEIEERLELADTLGKLGAAQLWFNQVVVEE